MKLDTDFIEKLANIITRNGLTEISLEDGEQAITVRRDVQAVSVQAPSAYVAPKVDESDSSIEAAQDENKGKAIVSPMVGTFYSSSSDDGAPFVEVGSSVKEGDIVCLIEAMKLMNEIKSEYSGKITQICVKDGDPIEYGQVLMYVE